MKYSALCFLMILSSLLLSCAGGDFEMGEALEAHSTDDQAEAQETDPENEPDETEEITPSPQPPGEVVVEPPPEPAEPEPACLKSLYYDHIQPILPKQSCKKASSSQISQVNQGNLKRDEFLATCYQETGGSCWCDQLIRPNPSSLDTFRCTYGQDQVHQLIHPDEDTWPFAFEAVKIVEEFEDINLFTQIIYNWWRPEPYNQNVGGAAGRHPFGTSIDIRFQTKSMQNAAFELLCDMRKRGRLRAIGYYSSTAIHLGIGDSTANTWGKSCP